MPEFQDGRSFFQENLNDGSFRATSTIPQLDVNPNPSLPSVGIPRRLREDIRRNKTP